MKIADCKSRPGRDCTTCSRPGFSARAHKKAPPIRTGLVGIAYAVLDRGYAVLSKANSMLATRVLKQSPTDIVSASVPNLVNLAHQAPKRSKTGFF